MDSITPFDLHRMFVGDAPPLFLAEVAVRTLIMFLYTVALVRLLGKRGMRQLAPFELVIIIGFGSAVGDPMFYADVPLSHALLVVTMIVGLQQGLVRITQRSEKAERLMEGPVSLIVRDGTIDIEALRKERFARDELFAELREAGVEHLGQVRLAFLESSGSLSVFRFPKGELRTGLSVLPDTPAVVSLQDFEQGTRFCSCCGIRGETTECPECGVVEWAAGVRPGGGEEAGDEPPPRRRLGRFLNL